MERLFRVRCRKYRPPYETIRRPMPYNTRYLSTHMALLENIQKMTDVELIAKAIPGREDGFEELVRRYQRPITNYVYRMLNDYDSSLDVTQEVFIKVYN